MWPADSDPSHGAFPYWLNGPSSFLRGSSSPVAFARETCRNATGLAATGW
jgi:hypothetical protein